MVTATEWLKKAEAKRSKNPGKFKAVRRRAWDYVEPTQSIENTEDNENIIWEQNKEQSGIVDGINSEHNREQSENKKEQNKEQSEIESKNKYENNLNVAASVEPSNNHGLMPEDTAQKRILTLTGHQKQIMRQITSHIKSRVGAPYVVDILPNILAGKIKASLEVTRVTLKRLTEKNILIRLPGERGRNGCCKFKIPENVVRICFSLFNDAPCDINQIGNEIENRNGNNKIYSSSNIINTTTALPKEWKNINFSPLESIGFSEQHLLDIYSTNVCDPNVVQESIYHFAFGLEEGRHKSYDNPLKVFIGRLRKGNAWFELNYESPKEKALRELFERKKTEKEKRDSMIKEIVDIEFPEWRKKLTQDEVKHIIPAETLKANLTPAITACHYP